VQSHKEKEREQGKNERGALPREAGLHMDIYAAPPSPRVPSYANADGAGLQSQSALDYTTLYTGYTHTQCC